VCCLCGGKAARVAEPGVEDDLSDDDASELGIGGSPPTTRTGARCPLKTMPLPRKKKTKGKGRYAQIGSGDAKAAISDVGHEQLHEIEI